MKFQGRYKFVKDIIKDVEASGLSVELVNDEYVWCDPDDHTLASRSCGWFDPDDERCAIQVATKRSPEEWLGTLIHEYSHFQQWKENPDMSLYESAMGDIEEWTRFEKELTEERLWECVRVIRADELDAEQRTVKMLLEWKVCPPERIREYIQGANDYAITYNMIAISRHWPDPPAYRVEDVWRAMPVHFLEYYDDAHIPYVKLFYKHCLKIKAPEHKPESPDITEYVGMIT